MHTFTCKTSSYICLITAPDKTYCSRSNSGTGPISWKIIFDPLRFTDINLAPLWMKFGAADEHSRQFINMPEEALQMVLSQVSDQNLRHTLQFGIGLHHAGLNDKDRSLVEELFANNKIQACIYYLKNLNYFYCLS
jgi:hypothetical protein